MKAFNWIGPLALGFAALGLFSQAPATTPAIQRPPQVTAQSEKDAPVIAQQSATPQGDRVPGQVISTGDGDTLTATINGQQQTIRLACVDAV
jgi:endonuclease YncB( thermonuclease family)